MSKNNTKKISKSRLKKQKLVEQISKEIQDAKTVCLVSLKNLPDRILQKARKELRGQIKIIVAKKAVIQRALEKNNKKFKIKLDFPAALVLSNVFSPYKLYQTFKNSAQKVFAKPGQIAEQDIEVKAGETDLPPGPALTELKNASIPAIIKGGKIAIQKDVVVVKKGEIIKEQIAKALQKLNIAPFEVFIKIKEGIFEGVNYGPEVLEIEPQKIKEEIAYSYNIASNLAVNIFYPTTSNIDQLLTIGYRQAIELAKSSNVYSSTTIKQSLETTLRQAYEIDKILNTKQ
ncbi:MAG: 50S ribosomal protein L10 [Candidatus Anstonellaceae archaeon]